LKDRAEIDEELLRHKISITVLFTDIVDSTAYSDLYGDTAGLIMIRRIEELCTRAVVKFKGRVIKTIGDSVMAEFPAPALAARAAVEIQRRVTRLHQTLPEHDRLLLRIGINAGEAFRYRGDVFGDMVNVAARIIKQTGAAQILVSHSLRDAISCEPDLSCIPKGTVEMKGKAENQEIFELIWCGGLEYTAGLQPSAATGAMSDRSIQECADSRLQRMIESGWKWILAGSIAVMATGGFIVQRNLPKIECSIFHSCPPLPLTPGPKTPIQGVPVTVADSWPFYITLDDDIPADAPGGQAVSFTVRDGLKAGDTVVMAKGAKVTGSIVREAGRRMIRVWSRKMNFLLRQADAVDGQKLNIRATPGHAGNSPASRPFDTGKGSKSKELAAAKGTEYVVYTDGEQTVSVRK
jgi:class 3 adenylate cyclase